MEVNQLRKGTLEMNNINQINLSKREILSLDNFLTMYDERFLSEELLGVKEKLNKEADKFKPKNTLVITKSHHSGNIYIQDMIKRNVDPNVKITRKNKDSKIEVTLIYDEINLPNENILIIPMANIDLLKGFILEKPHSNNPFLIDFSSFLDNETDLVLLAINKLEEVKRRVEIDKK